MSTSAQYSGANRYPSLEIKRYTKTLVKDKDYTVTYDGNTKYPGKVTVIIKGKGNYTGTVKKDFTIYVAKPRNVSGKRKMVTGSEYIAIDWDPVLCTGYEIQRYVRQDEWKTVVTGITDTKYTMKFGAYRVRAYFIKPGTSKKIYSEGVSVYLN